MTSKPGALLLTAFSMALSLSLNAVLFTTLRTSLRLVGEPPWPGSGCTFGRVSGWAGSRPVLGHTHSIGFSAVASHSQTLPGEPRHICSVAVFPNPCVAIKKNKAALGRKETALYIAHYGNESY